MAATWAQTAGSIPKGLGRQQAVSDCMRSGSLRLSSLTSRPFKFAETWSDNRCVLKASRPVTIAPLRARTGDYGAEVRTLANDSENLAQGIADDLTGSSAEAVKTMKGAVADTSADVERFAEDKTGRLMQTGIDAVETAKDDLTPEFVKWNGLTEKLTLASSFSGLFLMAPQILKNAELLGSGQAAAVGILPWVGYTTGFLGNMLLLSYFASKRELAATMVQTVGATSTCILLSQIYLAGYMPPPAFIAVASFLGVGLVVNALRYLQTVPDSIWSVWEDVIGVIGLGVLPQVVCQTVFPDLHTPLPGAVAVLAAATFVMLLRTGRLSEDLRARWAKLSGWTATLLFMFMPVAQLKECFTRPASLAGISPLGPVMGIISNGLMIPRALFTRDLMWFTGATWGALMMGWGILLSMVVNNAISQPFFAAASAALVGYLTFTFVRDSRAYNLSSPLASFQSLLKKGL